MKLLLLYGPPATGKLTVAQILSQETGYLLFHNHMVVDFVEPIFPRGTAGYERLIQEVWLAVFKEGVTSNLPGIITTMVFAPSRQTLVDSYCNVVEGLSGEVCLVQLTCDREIMLERVTAESRRGWNKLQSREKLQEALATLEDPFQIVQGRSSLIIDTGITDPETAVAKIIQQYDLREAV